MVDEGKARSLTDSHGEVRELGPADFANAKAFGDLPGRVRTKLRQSRGPQSAPTKEQISIR